LILRSLRAIGWRNLAPLALEPGPRATVFFGQNGQGKTNLLEAVYYLVEFRSFRTKAPADLVGWNVGRTQLAARAEAGGLSRAVQVELGPGQKTVRVDGKGVRRDSAALRGLGVVLFVPEDLLLPRAVPASRRSFLDRAAFNVDRAFFAEADAFQRVLKSRNALLRRGLHSTTLLATYDEQVAKAGARLVMRRRSITSALAPRVRRLFVALHADLAAEIYYRSDPSIEAAAGEDAVREAIERGLVAQRDRDLRRGFTGFGPHTDDLEILLAGRPVREHGSQGQVRSLVLALKLAELENLQEALGAPPLLLLDDVASELDEIRRRKLFETIIALPGQTLITVTDRHLIPELPGRIDFEVVAGQIRGVEDQNDSLCK
jgi:DNA replication and repair protein RecF